MFNLISNLVGLFFTSFCVLCSNISYGYFVIFCEKCCLKVKNKNILKKNICQKCSSILRKELCDDCRFRERNMEIFFDRHYSCFVFKGKIKKILNFAKFKKKEYIFYHLGRLMASQFYFLEKENFILIPVPISKERYFSRGFNPSYSLAKGISNYFRIPVYQNLKKIYHNDIQSKLSYKKRIKNPYNTYSFDNSSFLKKKYVYLLDDIFTTGSTINECSRILKKKGISKIIAITFAKTQLKSYDK